MKTAKVALGVLEMQDLNNTISLGLCIKPLALLAENHERSPIYINPGLGM